MIEPNANNGDMTIRGAIAAMAMQGLLTQHWTEETDSGARDLNPIYMGKDRQDLAKRAVQHADALIAELNKQQPTT